MAVIHCCNFERAFCVLLSLLLRTLPSSNLQAFSKHVISLPASFSLKTLLLPCIVKQGCQFQVVVTSALKKMDPLHEIDSTALKLSNMSCFRWTHISAKLKRLQMAETPDQCSLPFSTGDMYDTISCLRVNSPNPF